MTRESEFAAALTDPSLPVPAGLSAPGVLSSGGVSIERRFAVYRNNVTVGLVDALAAGFPVVAKLVGERFFRAMAQAFAVAHPPETPVMTLYGAAFPPFLDSFEPVRKLPYLGDVARLEFARRQVFHAADGPWDDPLGAPCPLESRLRRMKPKSMAAARPVLHPAMHVVRSRYPVQSIWRRNVEDDAAPVAPIAEDVLVVRRAGVVRHIDLPAGGALFLEALATGASLGAAVDAVSAARSDADPAAFFYVLISERLVGSIVVEET